MTFAKTLADLATKMDSLGHHWIADQLDDVLLWKAAAPADMTKSEEKYWNEAEKIVKEEYSPDKNPDKYYGTVTNIFKAKVKKHLKHNPFKKKKRKSKKKK